MQGLIRMMCAMIVVIVVSAAAYAGPLPPASEALPAGFKVTEEMNMGSASTIKAKSADGAEISIGWQMNPMADRLVGMIAGQPEEKISEVSGLRDEPCGKQQYLSGILTCRKWTRMMIAESNENTRVSFHHTWQGAASGGLVGIDIKGASKETAMKWLDSMVPKIRKAK